MKLTNKQSAAVGKMVEETPDFRLAGFAGSGKTAILSEVAKKLPPAKLRCVRCGMPRTEFQMTDVMCKYDQMHRFEWSPGVIFSAPTNKACQVLRGKLPADATVSTIHSLALKSEDITELREFEEADPKDPTKTIIVERDVSIDVAFVPRKDPIDQCYIIIDEASMVGEKLMNDILDIIPNYALVGDPAQLPPVKDRQIITEEKSDIILDQIFRQAEGSPILDYAHAVRKKHFAVDPEEYGIKVMKRKLSNIPDIASDDVAVLCWKNSTRRNINVMAMKMLFGSTAVVVGTKIMLYANYPVVEDPDQSVYNSENGVVVEVHDSWPLRCFAQRDTAYEVSVEFTNGAVRRFVVTEGILSKGADFRGDDIIRMPSWIKDQVRPYSSSQVWNCEFGYAISCHKSQGSQWPKVYILDESAQVSRYNGGKDAAKWLYTAITRAAEELVILR